MYHNKQRKQNLIISGGSIQSFNVLGDEFKSKKLPNGEYMLQLLKKYEKTKEHIQGAMVL